MEDIYKVNEDGSVSLKEIELTKLKDIELFKEKREQLEEEITKLKEVEKKLKMEQLDVQEYLEKLIGHQRSLAGTRENIINSINKLVKEQCSLVDFDSYSFPNKYNSNLSTTKLMLEEDYNF